MLTKVNSARNYRIVVSVFILLLLLAFGLGLYRAGNLNLKGQTKLNSDYMLDISEGWINAQTGESVEIPSRVQVVGDTLTIERNIDGFTANRGCIMLQSNRQNVSISYNGNEILKIGEIASGVVPESVNAYLIAEIPGKDSGTLSITFAGCRGGVCDLNNIYAGSKGEMYLHLFEKKKLTLILFIAILMIAVEYISVSIYAAIKKFWISELGCAVSLLLLSGIWFMSELPIWYTVNVPIGIVSMIGFNAFMLIPVPILWFSYHRANIFKPAIKTMATIMPAYVAISDVFYFYRMVSFGELILIDQGLVLVALLIATIVTTRRFNNDSTHMNLLLMLTCLVPFTTAVLAIFVYWADGAYAYDSVFKFGFGLLLILLAFDVMQAMADRAYADKLEIERLNFAQMTSTRDPLTNIGNRRLFEDTREIVFRDAPRDAVLIIFDVDGLKSVNDLYGHEAGDKLIMATSECITNLFQSSGGCFRIGGDEFAVIIINPPLTDEQYSVAIEEELQLYREKNEQSISLAYGFSHLYTENRVRKSVERWTNDADREMYASKLRSHLEKGDLKTFAVSAENVDELTGLLDFTGFKNHATEQILKNEKESYALLSLDIRKFRLVNDFFGYEVGDKLLSYVGRLILHCLKAGESCGRVSGDSFVMLIKYNAIRIQDIFDYICNHANRYFEKRNRDYRSEFAAGMYVLTEADRLTPDINKFMDLANMAKVTIKSNVGNELVVFSSDMYETQRREQIINQTLDAALENGDISVWLQPQYNYDTGSISGAEALCRWDNSVLGMVSPAEFIPVLERTGQIVKLDHYVWETVCKQLKEWRDKGRMLPPSVSVNISRIDTLSGNVTSTLKALLEKYELPASILHVEITESGFVDNPDILVSLIDELHEIGFIVEMDDFGSGYSSLNMLKEMPVDTLKLDMRFIGGINDEARAKSILKAIAQMAKELDMEMIAEGIESDDQAEMLANIGCFTMQGYKFSRPKTMRDFEEHLPLAV